MNTSTNLSQTEPRWLQVLKSQVASTRFGVVQIVIHDSRVVQIERTVKIRLSGRDGNGLTALENDTEADSTSAA
jgi:hypothetical protein